MLCVCLCVCVSVCPCVCSPRLSGVTVDPLTESSLEGYNEAGFYVSYVYRYICVYK